MAKKKKESESNPITFRLKDKPRKILDERAEALRMSSNTLARELVLKGLADQGGDQILEELRTGFRSLFDQMVKGFHQMAQNFDQMAKGQSTSESVMKTLLNGVQEKHAKANEKGLEHAQELRKIMELFRDDFATATAALLVKAGKFNERQASDFVQKELLHFE